MTVSDRDSFGEAFARAEKENTFGKPSVFAPRIGPQTIGQIVSKAHRLRSIVRKYRKPPPTGHSLRKNRITLLYRSCSTARSNARPPAHCNESYLALTHATTIKRP